MPELTVDRCGTRNCLQSKRAPQKPPLTLSTKRSACQGARRTSPAMNSHACTVTSLLDCFTLVTTNQSTTPGPPHCLDHSRLPDHAHRNEGWACDFPHAHPHRSSLRNGCAPRWRSPAPPCAHTRTSRCVPYCAALCSRIAAAACGSTSCNSPTMAKSLMSNNGQSGSEFTAITTPDACIPPRWCGAPEIPAPMYTRGATVTPVCPI